MKKLLASVLVFGLFFFGCNPSDCGKVKKYYDIQGISILNAGYNPDFGNYGTVSDSVNYPDHALSFGFSTIYYASASGNFSFIPQAIASEDCLSPGEAGTKERLSAIHLITLSDLNGNYKAGDTIDEMVTIIPYSLNGMQEEITLADYFELAKYRFPAENNLIKLKEKPDQKVKQAFKMIFTLTNGETYTAESAPITIY